MRSVFLLVLLLQPEMRAQFGPLVTPQQAPQAKSEEEFDLYLELYASTDPQSTIALAKKFAATYPASDFLELTYEHQMLAYQQVNNYDGALGSGRQGPRPRGRETFKSC